MTLSCPTPCDVVVLAALRRRFHGVLSFGRAGAAEPRSTELRLFHDVGQGPSGGAQHRGSGSNGTAANPMHPCCRRAIGVDRPSGVAVFHPGGRCIAASWWCQPAISRYVACFPTLSKCHYRHACIREQSGRWLDVCQSLPAMDCIRVFVELIVVRERPLRSPSFVAVDDVAAGGHDWTGVSQKYDSLPRVASFGGDPLVVPLLSRQSTLCTSPTWFPWQS